MTWADLEHKLNAPPQFYVQMPDGVKDWSEDARMIAFFSMLHRVAPNVMAHHIKNEGKYNHAHAARGGVVAGVFDIAIYGKYPLAAVIELKGYTKAGRPGTLSQTQIDWGNRIIDCGWHAACFFCPYAAIRWLAERGFPVRAFVETPPAGRRPPLVKRRT